MNKALLLSSFAFASFVLGFAIRYSTDAPVRAASIRFSEWNPPMSTIGGFLVLGMLGFYLYSAGGTRIEMLMDPKLAKQVSRSNETGLAEATATMLRPFLTAGLILLWIRLMHLPMFRFLPMKIAGSVVVSAFVGVAMSTYSFNRAAFAVPMVAMAAVLTNRYRMSVKLFWATAMLALVPLWVVGTFRKNATHASDFIDLLQNFTANEPVRQLSEGLQVYGGGPQFLGYLLEQQAEAPLYWGSTLLASVLSPVPVVGRAYRERSGTAVYNYLIYGSSVSADQVLPFSGELLMNFHLPGVFTGFLLLGMCLAWVHRKFRTCQSPVDSYFCQYGGMWLSFLVTGSVFVIAQIAVYMCLPMYSWLLLRRVRTRSRGRTRSVPAPQYLWPVEAFSPTQAGTVKP